MCIITYTYILLEIYTGYIQFSGIKKSYNEQINNLKVINLILYLDLTYVHSPVIFCNFSDYVSNENILHK